MLASPGPHTHIILLANKNVQDENDEKIYIYIYLKKALMGISEKMFQNCFAGWPEHSRRFIPSQGEYLEGYRSDTQQ